MQAEAKIFGIVAAVVLIIAAIILVGTSIKDDHDSGSGDLYPMW